RRAPPPASLRGRGARRRASPNPLRRWGRSRLMSDRRRAGTGAARSLVPPGWLGRKRLPIEAQRYIAVQGRVSGGTESESAPRDDFLHRLVGDAGAPRMLGALGPSPREEDERTSAPGRVP